ncbi:hypothetical protein [Paenibacillus glacialis]|uniref:Uncharacterized protein n=1 Tax=Paenibacillus glacialis TaxID=494026 RepID=A0A162LRQ4_9BACL|nr:hypothetical protein [Paenibacillus glacialis]OAB38857.1 hypothetical protein PGLA_19580 [Paenibacillus glacialis]
MAMEHKAYLFDTDAFSEELGEIIIASGATNDIDSLKAFITKNMGKVRSVYTGELLNNEWEKEIENGSVQELTDFAMTCYYSPEEELGFSYTWDALLEALSMVSPKFHPDYYILGRQLESGGFTLNPGGMGLGFVYADDIPSMYNELIDLKQKFIDNGMPSSNDLVYQITFPELIEAYDELIILYKEAKEAKCGLLMTF